VKYILEHSMAPCTQKKYILHSGMYLDTGSVKKLLVDLRHVSGDSLLKQICGSLNNCNVMKAKPSRLIPHEFAGNSQAFNFVV